jgi:2-methylcitrate dehydratase PrpD
MRQTEAQPRREHPEPSSDAAEPIGAYLARTIYSDLPASVVSAVKICILDMLSCILAGTSADDVATIASLVQGWGGAPTCTVIGSRGLTLPPMARPSTSTISTMCTMP